jgi:hypothetical protein
VLMCLAKLPITRLFNMSNTKHPLFLISYFFISTPIVAINITMAFVPNETGGTEIDNVRDSN